MTVGPQRDPEQLKMFMSAREIRAGYQGSDYDRQKTYPSGEPSRLETDDELFDRKTVESTTKDWDNLYGRIADEGVTHPVHLSHQFGSQGKKQIGEGHHRIAASEHIDPDRLMPVLHHEDVRAVGDYHIDHL